MNISDTPIFVLAGGRATRLKHLSQNLPKYLMPVDKNRCFADIHLDWIRQQGFKNVFLSIGYLGDQIMDYCKDGSRWGLNIKYFEDGTTPLGTGGAVRLSLKEKFDYLAITYGDTILSLDSSNLLKSIQTDSHALGLMTVYPCDVPGHVCNATMIDGKVIYNKLHTMPNWQHIDYGFLILKRACIESFSEQTPLDLAMPLSEISEQGKLIGFEVKARFWEIGSVESLSEFQKKFQ